MGQFDTFDTRLTPIIFGVSLQTSGRRLNVAGQPACSSVYLHIFQ
jgi:hypothetical protein